MGGAITTQIKKIPTRKDFYIGSIIGVGGFGIIREVRRLSNDKWYALKEYDITKITTINEAQIILNEYLALERIQSHPFIIKLYAIFHEVGSTNLLMELLCGGDLRLSMQSYDLYNENKTAYIIACIGSALHHLHLHGIIHRDIKPENIMFDISGIPKLIDFGMSYTTKSIPLLSSSSSSSNICICQSRSGTKEYLAPEVFVPETHYHSYESDFWSLGMVMYELLFRYRPFKSIIPISMIKYSQDTYKSAWESLVNASSNSSSITTITTSLTTSAVATAPFLSGTTASLKTFISESYDLNEMRSNTTSNFIQLSSFMTNFDETPLNSDLVISIPDFNSCKEKTSIECKNLLLSLLDVRVHLRYGVNDRYSSFIDHNWFQSNGYSRKKLLEYSPAPPDINRVGDTICGKFLKKNFEDKDETKTKGFPKREIHRFVNSIKYVSPDYYPIN
mmetsp:Transcript_4064/g.4044  ORF Transcript_4064/g.4044 Transcript_4064/m.4044 type:complete len:448 (+) Transcript_4064:89-1432(+)